MENLRFLNRLRNKNTHKSIVKYILWTFGSIVLILLATQSFLQTENISKRKQIAQLAVSYIENDHFERQFKSMSCSEYTRFVFKIIGIDLPTTAHDQFHADDAKVLTDPLTASLVFFTSSPNNKHITHVGIYLQNDTFIHSPGKGKSVRYDNLTQDYWENRLIGFKDYLPEN